MAVIKVENLSKIYKKKEYSKSLIKNMFWPNYSEHEAVKDISFEINEGESVAFLGPNGAGKTTTIKMLSGLMSPSRGSISVLGYTPFSKETDYLKQIGLVMGSKNGLSWDLTINQNFWILQKIYEISKDNFESRVTSMVEMLSIGEVLNTQVRKLSLGQRMKAELIASLIHNPKVLFLDEPTIGLDVTTKKIVREFLREVQRKFKSTILLTSHDMDDVETVCDRVIIINEGVVAIDLPLKELVSQYSDFKYVNLLFESDADAAEFKISDSESVEVSSRSENQVRVKVRKAEYKKFLNEVLMKENLKDIDLLSIPLEDIVSTVFRGGNK